MAVLNNNALVGASGKAGPTAGRSVRFNAPDSAYLSRTPASAGNQKTFTWSSWIKRSKEANVILLCNADAAANNGFYLAIYGNKLFVETYTTTSAWNVTTNRLFRDFSAWYHIVVAVDTTQSTASNRVKIYVNGVQETSFSTSNYPSQNYDTLLNNTTFHAIGRAGQNSASNFDGYMALVHLIDGQQLTPSSFGETSATTGRWEAKTYAGSYSGNSFFLDFLDNSAATATTLGKDSSGLGNNWVPNNIQATVPSNSVILPASNAPSSVEYLVVGGGGGGGSNYAGGGGGGGFRTGTLSVTAGATYSVQVGLGGAGATTANSNGANGTDSIFSSITSIGGGGGGGAGGPSAGSGGSGGGSVSQARGLGTAGQGNNGAQGSGSGDGGGGGGGGAGAAGTAGAASLGGAGGAGSSSSITGTSITYAGGGGGGTEGLDPGVGGAGGGGRGGYGGSNQGVNGTANRGGGGGGGGGSGVPGRNGGNGGSGIVVIRYANTYADLTIGGGLTYTSANTGGYKIYTITASSTDTAAGVDSLRDHPTSAGTSTGLGGEVSGNYATLNPLEVSALSGVTLSNGNLQYTTSSANAKASSTIVPPSGKWYCELTVNSATYISFGISKLPMPSGSTLGFYDESVGWYQGSGNVIQNYLTEVTNGLTLSNGDVLGLALDATNKTVAFYKNGVVQHSPSTISYSYTSPMAIVVGTGVSGAAGSINFGQRAFAYAAPSGFSPLVDTLLPTPTIAKPNTVMDAVAYTGTGSSNTITLPGSFNPDFIWIKRRSAASDHVLMDVVRGFGSSATKVLYSNLANSEDTTSVITSTSSTGFTIGGSGIETNANGSTYVAWTWDAGSSNATNTSGTITSTVRTNISAGFSVISYAATGSNGTVGHGLGVAPAFIIGKNRSSTSLWRVYHSSIAATKVLFLNSTDGETTDIAFNSTAPTSSVISVNGSEVLNNSGNIILYAWAPVAGYSAFGSYTGNGSATDAPFIWTGFRPKLTLVKANLAGEHWSILDSSRNSYNPTNLALRPNLSSAEGTEAVDFLSNGFKPRNAGGEYNASGVTYIYCAWAEAPFQYARAR